jgi:hypothetical protein
MTTADIAVPQGRNVEEVLREGGLSHFHKKAILVTGAAWTFVAMEILLVGFAARTGSASSRRRSGRRSAGGRCTRARLAERLRGRAMTTALVWIALNVSYYGLLKDATGSTTWSLTFIAIVMALGGVVAAIFGRETKGQSLA